MTPEMTPLLPTDRFRFECGEAVPCFNACCRDLNQFLTPYDILRLKTHLGMTSGRFLGEYTVIRTGPQTGLPVASFRQEGAKDHPCPFVSPSGCRVYSDRPSSCRIYPVARLLSRSRETDQTSAHHALLKEAHCRGFDRGREWTVAEWTENQGVAPYNEMNDRLMAIIALKNRSHPGPLSLTARHAFQLALYDLDAFRTQVFENESLRGFHLDPELLEQAKTDDEVLLRVGFHYIEKIVFGTDAEAREAAQ